MTAPNYTTIRDAAAAALSAALATPEPTFATDGQRIERDQHLAQLQATTDWAQKHLDDAAAAIAAAAIAADTGPLEIRSQATT